MITTVKLFLTDLVNTHTRHDVIIYDTYPNVPHVTQNYTCLGTH